MSAAWTYDPAGQTWALEAPAVPGFVAHVWVDDTATWWARTMIQGGPFLDFTSHRSQADAQASAEAVLAAQEVAR